LIAQALAADKRVLFVAEKMAALSVVHARLVAAGLGEFCLELHSTKANKRAVMQALGAALDASLQGVAAPTASTERLPAVRATLADYVRAVHAPHGALGASPYQGYGEYGRVMGAPARRTPGPPTASRASGSTRPSATSRTSPAPPRRSASPTPTRGATRRARSTRATTSRPSAPSRTRWSVTSPTWRRAPGAWRTD
jgi:hypothetical protein